LDSLSFILETAALNRSLDERSLIGCEFDVHVDKVDAAAETVNNTRLAEQRGGNAARFVFSAG
jgi:hypothetical protein